jgi:hypothetical protein
MKLGGFFTEVSQFLLQGEFGLLPIPKGHPVNGAVMQKLLDFCPPRWAIRCSEDILFYQRDIGDGVPRFPPQVMPGATADDIAAVGIGYAVLAAVEVVGLEYKVAVLSPHRIETFSGNMWEETKHTTTVTGDNYLV